MDEEHDYLAPANSADEPRTPNSIQRLRAKLEADGWLDHPDSALHDLAAVDALYQAAKTYLAAEDADDEAIRAAVDNVSPDPEVDETLRDAQKETAKAVGRAYDALAAAVRRVDGDA